VASLDLPANLPARSGTYNLNLVVGGDCMWTAAAEVEGWASITPTSGRGSATPTLRVSENVRNDPRTLTVRVNTQLFRAIQEGITCVYTLSAPGMEIGEDAGQLAFVVMTQPDCPWTATSSESWVSVATPSGSGSGTVLLNISRNTGDTRQAVVIVASQRVTITQRRAF
jgi:hypothetical protein